MRTGRCEPDPLSLNPELERWAREQGWTSLRPFQEESRDLILGSTCDMIVTASTSAGKTEAVFLPLLTIAARRREGVSFLCLSPTKALINDQERRLIVPASRVRVPIWKWHGDASDSRKNRLLKERRGGVLITPESLEGLMFRHPRIIEELFEDLDAVVIDEFHEFLEGSRGAQVGSLLSRVDNLVEKLPRRIALSATIADISHAQRYLRPQEPRAVKLVNGPDEWQALRSIIRGYTAPPANERVSTRTILSSKDPVALRAIEASIYERLRDGTHIVFAASRSNVESLCDGLAARCQRAQVRNPFVPHHGSIAKDKRETVEKGLRSGTPFTAISTNTLGLGVDIGSVDSVEMIGAPMWLTAFRQNIGRSGRRDAPARVCLHVTEHPVASAIRLRDRLRLSTVRACAALNLLERRFFEPPKDDGTLLSVVFQQLLSIIRQRSGVLFSQLVNSIQSVAAFHFLTDKMLRQILDHLTLPEQGFIELTSEGRYVLTEKGGKLVHGKEFYASFRTTDQWDVVAEDRTKIGSFSLANGLAVGKCYCLAGRPWEVKHLDLRHYRATVVPALSGDVPIFDQMVVGEVHEKLAQEMRCVLEDDKVPGDCDPVAGKHLEQGRAIYRDLDLANNSLVTAGDNCHLVAWRGTRFNRLLVELLRAKGFVCAADEIGVTIAATQPRQIVAALQGDLPDLVDLSTRVTGILNGKYDRHIPENLLRAYWTIRNEPFDISLREFCRSMMGSLVEDANH